MQYSLTVPDDVESCVYKLWYDGRYIIEKCKNLPVSISKLINGLNAFLKNTEHGRDTKNLAYNFFNYILWNEGKKVELEILFISRNPYLLLKREQEELYKAQGDENCLNKSFDAYIPMFTQVNGEKSWINRGYYLNFCIWKKKINQNKTA